MHALRSVAVVESLAAVVGVAIVVGVLVRIIDESAPGPPQVVGTAVVPLRAETPVVMDRPS